MIEWMQNPTGQWGLAVLNFYQSNSLWINLLVLAYGAWVVLSWVNLKNIRKALLMALVDQLRSQVDPISGKVVQIKDSPDLTIPWEGVVGQARFPFIALQSALLPRRVSVKTTQAMLPAKTLIADAVRILQPPHKKIAR
jgi:hypothetical protein